MRGPGDVYKRSGQEEISICQKQGRRTSKKTNGERKRTCPAFPYKGSKGYEGLLHTGMKVFFAFHEGEEGKKGGRGRGGCSGPSRRGRLSQFTVLNF